MSRVASDEEVNVCLEHIRKHPAAGADEQLSPAIVYAFRSDEGRQVHITFTDLKTLPIGATYKTWFVTCSASAPVQVEVSHFRRAAGPNEMSDEPVKDEK